MDHKEMKEAHKYSLSNREALRKSALCGCFHCLKIFPPTEIREWIRDKNGQTALCPYCGIDAVIGDSSGYAISTAFLEDMKEYWFD